MIENREAFSNNLNRLMASRDVDRNKLVEDLGLKYTTIADWTKGKTFPRIDKIELLANYFGVQKSDLIEDKSETAYYINRNSGLAGNNRGSVTINNNHSPQSETEYTTDDMHAQGMQDLEVQKRIFKNQKSIADKLDSLIQIQKNILEEIKKR